MRYSHNYSLVPSKRTSMGAAVRADGGESRKCRLHGVVALPAPLPVPLPAPPRSLPAGSGALICH